MPEVTPRSGGKGGRPPVHRGVDGTALRRAEHILAAEDFRSAAQVFAALGNISRLHILQLLGARGPLTAAELRVAVPSGDVSQHLRVLVHAGVVESAGRKKASGAPVVFALADDALGVIAALLR